MFRTRSHLHIPEAIEQEDWWLHKTWDFYGMHSEQQLGNDILVEGR